MSFLSTKQKKREEEQRYKHDSINSVAKDFEAKHNIESYTEEQIRNTLTPSGHMKINPIISINDCDYNYPILINQKTGETANIPTYFGYMYAEARQRSYNLKNKQGLEYTILENEDITDKEKIDILYSNMENMDAAIMSILSEDLCSILSSTTCAIEEKIMNFLEQNCINSMAETSIHCPNSFELKGLFSYRYPNKNIDPMKITAASFFDFIVNRKMQIMCNYCDDVYMFLRSVVYNPRLQGLENSFDTRDTLYATLCGLIYDDLRCLDDMLAAAITQHCLRLDNNKNAALEIKDNFEDGKDQCSKITCNKF